MTVNELMQGLEERGYSVNWDNDETYYLYYDLAYMATKHNKTIDEVKEFLEGIDDFLKKKNEEKKND